jgi:hypothetical protein
MTDDYTDYDPRVDVLEVEARELRLQVEDLGRRYAESARRNSELALQAKEWETAVLKKSRQLQEALQMIVVLRKQVEGKEAGAK